MGFTIAGACAPAGTTLFDDFGQTVKHFAALSLGIDGLDRYPFKEQDRSGVF